MTKKKEVIYLFYLRERVFEDMEYYYKDFNDRQINEILRGQFFGVDTSIYADTKYSWEQMEEIREGLENGLSVEQVNIYADEKYNEYQMRQIRKGLEKGLSIEEVRLYADEKFNSMQMYEIRYGLENRLDVSIYADEKYNEYQMREIKYGLEQGLDISVYADLKFDFEQMREIREGLEDGLDVSIYANEKIESYQMSVIKEALLEGMSTDAINLITKPGLSMNSLFIINEDLRLGVDPRLVERYANPYLDFEDLLNLRSEINDVINEKIRNVKEQDKKQGIER